MAVRITLSSKEVEVIDWATPQLFRLKHNGAIIISSGHHLKDCFTGTVIFSSETEGSQSLGHQSEVYLKTCFEKYEGSITLENE